MAHFHNPPHSAPVPEARFRRFNFAGDVRHVPGWLTAAEGTSLFEAARGVCCADAIVEIGSFKGRSTLCLASGARSGHGARVFAIDPHQGNREHRRQFGPIDTSSDFVRNIEAAGLANIVAPVRDSSVNVAARFDRPVSLLFVDGDHRLSAMREDLGRWLPFVRDGGTIGVHDSWQIPGPHIATALELLTSRTIRRPRLVDTITFFEKTPANTLGERLWNRAFVLWRVFWGLKGLLRLKLTGSVVEPVPAAPSPAATRW